MCPAMEKCTNTYVHKKTTEKNPSLSKKKNNFISNNDFKIKIKANWRVIGSREILSILVGFFSLFCQVGTSWSHLGTGNLNRETTSILWACKQVSGALS